MTGFYKLTREEVLKSFSLKPAERDVLLWIRTIDPFGQGKEVTVLAIAEETGRNRSTVTRALNVLRGKGFIDLEITRVKITLKSIPLHTDDSHTNPVIPTHIEEFPHESCDSHTNPVIPIHIEAKPKPADSKEFTTSKNYLDYLRLLKTLSDDYERESFLNFCRRKADSLPQPVRMIDKWIFSNFEFLKAEFLKITGTKEITEETEITLKGQSSAPFRKPKKDLSEQQIEILQQAIANNEIKNFWFCEPLNRWMVLLHKGRQLELDVYFERLMEAIANECE